MDTVMPTEALKPQIRDGEIYSDGTTILGADDRAALAAYLEAVQVLQESRVPCCPIELILTISEQTSLLGSKHLDYSKVRTKSGYIFDNGGDVGQIVLGGPYGMYLHWTVEGKRAHLGLAAAEGVSAIVIAARAIDQMQLGQVDELTVANIGTISGGELGSIIPGSVKMLGEVRSFTQEGLDQQVEQMRQAVDGAARSLGGRAVLELEKKYLGYDIAEQNEHVQVAVRAARRIGILPYFTRTLGGADTNNFREHGLEVFTLGNGFREIHSFNEHISIQNLVNTARLSVSFVEEYTRSKREGGRQ
jgi:tripeptide aminopeptidase